MRTGIITIAAIVAATATATAGTAERDFADCSDCPEMVVVPVGEFTMGSPPDEMYRGAEDQHHVAISAPFALGKYEVTFTQWDACVADGGCGGYMPDDMGWGRGNRPVINISWNDAKAYAAWLSQKTGKKYRLPSEAEWEYAARAGTTTTFAFGTTITTDLANYDGSSETADSPAGVFREKTMPVGSFRPNALGLYDMHGNVWEWVEDCWSDEYTDAIPTNGAPYERKGCGGRVMRGGSWEDHPSEVRSAARVGGFPEDQFWSDGFRVALSME